MVIKPVEFAMIQQQNNIAKSQYNADNRPMTEQQTITQQVQKDINVHSQQVNKKDNADNETGKYDAKDKSNNEYSGEGNSRKKKKSDGKVFVKGQESADFDVYETMRCGGYNGRNRNISYSGWRNMCCCQRCYEFWR